MADIELGSQVPTLTVRVALSGSNAYGLELTDIYGNPLDFTNVTVALEVGASTFTADIADGVCTFTITAEHATRSLIDRNAALVLTDNGVRRILSTGRAVQA